MAADVTSALHLRQVELVMIAGTAIGTGEAAGNALDQRLLVDHQLNHMIKLATALGQ